MVAVQPKNRKVEAVLAELASAAYGVVCRRELRRAGVTDEEIKTRLRNGSLLRVHPGIYRVGHRAPSLEARYIAAVKACGNEALLAGRAAAYHFGILKGAAPMPEVMTTNQRRVEGVATRRCGSIRPEDVTNWKGIPTTTIPRTLVDLAATFPPASLARVFHEAAVRHRITPDSVERILSRRHNWPGARELRRIIWGEEPVSLSRLESSFIARLREAGLPLPETNPLVDGRRVDCRWPEHRLTVELDGYRYHHTRHAWEQDRRREREARARGDEFRRYTWADVREEPRPMLEDLSGLLGLDRAG